MNNLESIRSSAGRWLSLFFAPLAISLATIIITNFASHQNVPGWLWLATTLASVIALILYTITYHRTLDTFLSTFEQHRRALRYKKPNILILDGKVEGNPRETPPAPIHSNRHPIDWKSALSNLGWSVYLGPTTRIAQKPAPDIVVNPFGELYPESDFLTNATITKIREYVWAGGVFVSVAGIPFQYRYNPTTRRQEAAGRVEGISQEGNLIWIPLNKDLFPNLTPATEPVEFQATQLEIDVQRFGNIASAGRTPAITSFRAYPINPTQLMPMLRDPENQVCIIGNYQYGSGVFIFAGVSITDATPTFEKVVAAIKGWAEYEVRKRKP
jgi:hypothetical protein